MLNLIIEYWIEILFGLIITFITYLFRRITSYKKMIINTNKGILVILKSTIIEKYNEYIKKEVITINEKETFLDMYEAYKTLGGNSFIKDLVAKINDLKVIE